MAKVSKTLIVAEEEIISKIYYFRKNKVMLDSDLAKLYGIETKRLKEQVNRNKSRFPEHFMFELIKEESDSLRSHFATLKQGTHFKYLPYVFTEHGVLMLANVLKSEKAIEMSIKIIDVFVKLREMLLANKDILLKLEQLERKVTNHDENIKMIFQALKQLINPPQPARQRIGFKP